MKFVLIRHTTTDWNISKRIQGQTDTELTKEGRKEARELADIIKPLGISQIVSSDLKRASQTAEIINDKLHLPLSFNKRLRECSFGRLEGLTREQAEEQYGSSVLKHWDDQHIAYSFHAFGGEDRDEVLSRHLEILQEYQNNDSANPILIVGHGRGLHTLLTELNYPPLLKRGEYCIIEY